MAKNEYNGLVRKLLAPIVLVAGMIGCSYEKPVNEQGSNYPKAESRTPELKHSKKGLEGKVGAAGRKDSNGERDSMPEVSYETAYKFFEPELIKAKISPEEIERFKGRLKKDDSLRSLLYTIYSNPRKFEKDYDETTKVEFSSFKKSPFEYLTDEDISSLHKTFPLIPGNKKDLSYLKEPDKLNDKQYGDLTLLFVDYELRQLSDFGKMMGR